MKKIVILGSTGSIGKQTLDVIRKNKKRGRESNINRRWNEIYWRKS